MRINHVQLKKTKIILVIIEYKDGALSLITSDEANYISALEILFIPYKQHRLSVYLNLHHSLKCGLQ